MPFIGRTTDFRGKTLWEIVGNLYNFGVGRVVVRSMFERYPEPCYMKILKVEALPSPVEPSIDNVRLVKVWVEKTFRGKTYPKPVLIESASYKTDYRLLSKDEETEYCKNVERPVRILPKIMELPPLLKECIKQENIARGESPDKDLNIEIIYQKSINNSVTRVAQEGEKPNVEIRVGLGKPVSPSLYEGIKI